MKKLVFSILLIAGTVSSWAAGQRYIADDFSADKQIKLYAPTVDKDGKLGRDENNFILVPNGEEVVLVGEVWHYQDGREWGIVEYKGKKYAACERDLRFVADNEAGEGNVLQDDGTARHHSALGDFYRTATPFIIILILMICAGVLTFILFMSDNVAIMRLMTLCVPLLLLAGSIMEFGSLMYLEHPTWWIDVSAMKGSGSLGFGAAILRLIPLMLVVVIQLGSGYIYSLKVSTMTKSDDCLRFKSFFFFLVPLAVAFVTMLIFAFSGNQGHTMEVTCYSILFGGWGILFLWLWIDSARKIGPIMGLAYTIFGIVYAVGAIIAIWIFVMTVIKMIVRAIIALVFVGFIFYIVFRSGLLKSSSSSSGQTTYRDKDGHFHSSAVSMNDANTKIDIRDGK